MSTESWFFIITGLVIFNYMFSNILDYINHKNWKDDIPNELKDFYEKEKYKKAKDYSISKNKIGFLSSTISFLLVFSLLVFNGYGIINDLVSSFESSYIKSGLFFLTLFLINTLISLPFSYYNTFVIEERFGFNKTTLNLFIIDKIKGYAIFIVLGSIVIAPILYFFHVYGDIGWLIAWSILTAFMIAVQPLFVHVIAPMFNKFTPLEEGELRSAIEKYTAKVNFPLARIDIMDGSKRSAHSNAYFTGFGKSRRIAIFDTLVEKHSTNEIVSVVAHEVGHYKLKHVLQGTILGIIETGIMLFAFNLIMNDISLFQVFGVSQLSVHAGLVFFSMLYAPVSMFTSIVTTAISRKNEYEADKYSYDTTNNREALVSMLIGLSANNLSHLTPHPLKVFLSYSHPPVVDRIKAVNQYS